MGQLRGGLVKGPLAPPGRRRERAFVPHLTLDQRIEPARLQHALAALADYRAQYCFERLTVLEQDAQHRWWPLADAASGRPLVVGRGSLDLELSVVERPIRRGRVGRRAVGRLSHGPLRAGDPPEPALRRRRPVGRGTGRLRRGRGPRPGHRNRPPAGEPRVGAPAGWGRISCATWRGSGSTAAATASAWRLWPEGRRRAFIPGGALFVTAGLPRSREERDLS